MKILSKITLLFTAIIMAFSTVYIKAEEIPGLSAKSVILMESSTGRVIYENNADLPLPPASITKVMTLLLIMEDIESGMQVIFSSARRQRGMETVGDGDCPSD